MRIQFGTLLADIGLITLPNFNQVCCLLLCIAYEVGWVTKTPRVLLLAGTPQTNLEYSSRSGVECFYSNI